MTYHELEFAHLDTSWPLIIVAGDGLWQDEQGFIMESVGTPPNHTWRLSVEEELNEQVTLRKLRIRLDLRPNREDDVTWTLILQRGTHTASQSDATYQTGSQLFAEGVILASQGGTILDLDFDLDRRKTNTATGFNFVFTLFGPLGVTFGVSPIAITRTFWICEGIPVGWMAARAELATITDSIPVGFQP
jgi:hypothetical protein